MTEPKAITFLIFAHISYNPCLRVNCYRGKTISSSGGENHIQNLFLKMVNHCQIIVIDKIHSIYKFTFIIQWKISIVCTLVEIDICFLKDNFFLRKQSKLGSLCLTVGLTLCLDHLLFLS